jgi:hypothetical protein
MVPEKIFTDVVDCHARLARISISASSPIVSFPRSTGFLSEPSCRASSEWLMTIGGWFSNWMVRAENEREGSAVVLELVNEIWKDAGSPTKTLVFQNMREASTVQEIRAKNHFHTRMGYSHRGGQSVVSIINRLSEGGGVCAISSGIRSTT